MIVLIRLRREHVEEYRAIHTKELNAEISVEEAERMANDLVEL